MKEQKEMKQLKKILERHTYQYVCNTLGYKYPSAVSYWLRCGKMPKKALRNFDNLLKEIK